MSTLANPNYLGATLVLLVTGYQPGWVQAYIPVRPNETTRWIPSADVTTSFVTDHIVVSLSARKLTLYHDNAPVFSSSVAPGAPVSPTPTGSFFVAYIVKLTDPGNVYGPYALGTSAFSNTYYSFDGGPGQVGHPRDEPTLGHRLVRQPRLCPPSQQCHHDPGPDDRPRHAGRDRALTPARHRRIRSGAEGRRAARATKAR